MKVIPGTRLGINIHNASQCTPSVSVTVDANSWAREVMATCDWKDSRGSLTRLVSVTEERRLYCTNTSSLSLSLSLSHTHGHSTHLACDILFILYISTLTVFDQKQKKRPAEQFYWCVAVWTSTHCWLTWWCIFPASNHDWQAVSKFDCRSKLVQKTKETFKKNK